MKMSPARRALLQELSEQPAHVDQSYMPLKWLLERGLAQVHFTGKYGTVTYAATEEGKRVAKEPAGVA